MRLSINPEDILMSLDGIVYLEGRSGERIAAAVKDHKRETLDLLRRIAPDLSARQLTIDSKGRVRINHPKFAELALLVAEEENPTGKELGTAVGGRRRGGVHPADVDVHGELNLICAGDESLDFVCGTWDIEDSPPGENKPCDVDFFCGFS